MTRSRLRESMTTATLGYSAQLPPLDPTTGLLPPGVHPCSLLEFEHIFVDSAPHAAQRRSRFRALGVYIECLDEMFPGSTLWLDGGFVSHKAAPPFDIDVLAKVKPGAWASVMKTVSAEAQAFDQWLTGGATGFPPKTPTLTQFGGLQTHQMVQTERSNYPRIQPFGGKIDSFIVPADAAKTLKQFQQDWMTDFSSGAKKGFAEVKL